MSKNLTTNQTIMTLYINIPRLVVPINIPHSTDIYKILVTQCIGVGGVMLQLRYNGVMLRSSDVAQVTNQHMPDLVYCANLTTIKYLLLGIQSLLAEIYKVSIRPNNDIHDNTARARRRWFHFLNNISKGNFLTLMQEGFFEGYAAFVDFERDLSVLF